MMALLQGPPVCSWRRAAKAESKAVSAAAVRAPVVASCACVRIESRERGVAILSRGCKGRNGFGEWDEARRRAEGVAVLARRGGSGADASRAERSGASSRGRSKQQEASGSSRRPATKLTKSKKTTHEEEEEEENGLGEDALEALFAQLEMDLEAGGISDNEEFTEDDFIELEKELTEALMEIEDEEGLTTTDSLEGDAESGSEFDVLDGDSRSPSGRKDRSPKQLSSAEKKLAEPNSRVNVDDEEYDDVILEEYEEEEEEEEEQRIVNLEPWQLKKLAAAAELGRRKVNIKALSAEVGLDRSDVLAWLKNPPPELLMYSATMEAEETEEALPLDLAKSNRSPDSSMPTKKQDVEPNPEGRRNWQSGKRLRKVHEATFERVFSNTDRPSNSIIQNLVELTHVPRKRVVEWFEQRRDSIKSSPKFEALR